MIKHCRETLQQNGFTVDTSGSFKGKPKRKGKGKPKERERIGDFEPWHWILHYANAELRMIPNQPRSVLKAQNFMCPPENAAGLSLLLKKVEAGEPLRPHLSRMSSQADDVDDLLSDWGIQHFHLGTSMDSDGMISGTANVLFALVTRDKFHCITVLPHKDASGEPTWAHKELIEPVHGNWPELIEPFKMRSVMGGGEVSASDIRKLRAAGITPALQVGGDAYVSPGGGFATSGHSLRAMRIVMRYRRTARDFEKHVRELAPKISKCLAD